MEIIYPELVEQSIEFYYKNKADSLSKAEMYRVMVAQEIITENGLPTKRAMLEGWVKDYFEAENLDFESFLQIYPSFCQYDESVFQKIDGFWEVTLGFKKELIKKLEQESLDYDEKIQIEMYLSDR